MRVLKCGAVTCGLLEMAAEFRLVMGGQDVGLVEEQAKEVPGYNGLKNFRLPP